MAGSLSTVIYVTAHLQRIPGDRHQCHPYRVGYKNQAACITQILVGKQTAEPAAKTQRPDDTHGRPCALS